MSLPSDSVVRQVLGCFGVSVFAAQALGNLGGFSGAQLWRVSAPADDWCLRAFPKRKPTAYPAAAIHAAMKRARFFAGSSGIDARSPPSHSSLMRSGTRSGSGK